MNEKNLRTKACLVTGGAGFIGSHTCEAMLKNGYRVCCVDNFNAYYNPQDKRENIRAVIKTAEELKRSFSVYEGDIRDIEFLDRVFDENRPELVIHLAACAGVRSSIEDPILYTTVNINGTVNILECLKKYNINSYVFASSSSVYGNNVKVPFAESDAVDHPISPYAATKKAGELLCHTYHHLYGINTACLRFFTVYGPRQRPDLAISKFTKLISAGKPIPVFGDGTSKRDYTYIDDIVDGIIKACQWVGATESRFSVFNLGESTTVSLKEMIETLENALEKKAYQDRHPNMPGDVNITYADISHAKKVLGYDPKTTFNEGITQFLNWFKKTRL